jgi:dinuclear metal center YbgI/SA1388 family protein
MTDVQQVVEFLSQLAPATLAAEWDNTGLLTGDSAQKLDRIMTCLTITPDSASEAIEQGAGLVVSHHPLPFRPLKQIVTNQPVGKLLWDLIRAGIGIYSPHTAFDSAREGINQLWAQRLGLLGIAPLDFTQSMPAETGTGRYGRLPKAQSLKEVAQRVIPDFSLPGLHTVGALASGITKVAIACGSGGSMLALAKRAECDLFITGEASFHTCLEAEALGIAMILPGHYASERFGVEHLAVLLEKQFPDCRVWASERERDPLNWVNA